MGEEKTGAGGRGVQKFHYTVSLKRWGAVRRKGKSVTFHSLWCYLPLANTHIVYAKDTEKSLNIMHSDVACVDKEEGCGTNPWSRQISRFPCSQHTHIPRESFKQTRFFHLNHLLRFLAAHRLIHINTHKPMSTSCDRALKTHNAATCYQKE